MELNKYQIFLSIIERGSYNKVCEDYGYTQSGISKMMSAMESEIGFPLIVRSHKGITTTPEAERLMPLIQQLIKKNNLLEEEFSKIRGVVSGSIRLGCFPTLAFLWMPEIVQGFHAKHPGVSLEVIEDHNIGFLEQWINQGFLDVSVVAKPNTFKCDWIKLIDDPYVALLPSSHELRQNNIVDIHELFKFPVVTFSYHEGSDPYAESWMKYVDNFKRPVFTTNSDFTAVRIVEKNGFVTALPKSIAKYAVNNFDVIMRPLNVDSKREIGIAVKDMDYISPSTSKLIQVIKDLVESIN